MSLIIIRRIWEGNNITMATSLPILQFEPFIMEDREKLNLGVRWKKVFDKVRKLSCCDEYN